jgi:hypothetical protein
MGRITSGGAYNYSTSECEERILRKTDVRVRRNDEDQPERRRREWLNAMKLSGNLYTLSETILEQHIDYFS